MLNRLKAAWNVLFAPRYIAVSYDSIFELQLQSNADLGELLMITTSLSCQAEEAVEMNILVDEAKLILER